MNTYELVVMYNPDLKEAEIKAILDDLKSKVKELGGELDLSDDWGLKKLAYQIKKFDQAYYHIYTLKVDSTKINSVVTHLNHKEGVIRHLLSLLEKEI